MRYYEGWENWDALKRDFGIDLKEPRNIFAAYDVDGYEGYALVIFNYGRKYKIVEGSHCSCYGLEDQWKPTEHSKDEIMKMLEAKEWMFDRYRDQITKLLT